MCGDIVGAVGRVIAVAADGGLGRSRPVPDRGRSAGILLSPVAVRRSRSHVRRLDREHDDRENAAADGDHRWDPPFRGSLEFTPNIVPTGKLGDCVVPATLAFTLLADGSPQGNQEVRSGDRASLKVPAGTRRMAIEMEYINEHGAECHVRVSLANGQLVR
jgi:hypothetical protein